jgi:hypothetical protein
MWLDIRLPIGILFSLVGGILVIFGLLGDPSRYQQSLGININLIWGAVLMVFGLAMFLLGRRGMNAARTGADSATSNR